MTDLHRTYIKDANLITRRIAGESIIVPVKSRVGDLDFIYTLNETSASAWQLIDGRTPLSQIIACIGDEYDVSRDEATADLLELIDSLQSAGLIQIAA